MTQEAAKSDERSASQMTYDAFAAISFVACGMRPYHLVQETHGNDLYQIGREVGWNDCRNYLFGDDPLT